MISIFVGRSKSTC